MNIPTVCTLCHERPITLARILRYSVGGKILSCDLICEDCKDYSVFQEVSYVPIDVEIHADGITIRERTFDKGE